MCVCVCVCVCDCVCVCIYNFLDSDTLTGTIPNEIGSLTGLNQLSLNKI